AVGRMVSKDVRAYSYLPESIAAVPQGPEMTGIIAAAGFSEAKYIPMTFGTCTIYVGRK
ncbi:MAG: class I SAM-dependent methyltransferase, partial [Duncaniella sp.]|nr:class I SAM-dependent methyltransferase [Duncaniella sp.]